MPVAGLEKLNNAIRSVSTVNDRLFLVDFTKTAYWKSMSEFMIHSNFGKPWQGSSVGILVHLPLYCRFSIS